ncbi:MAG TPA: FHA domain-containing protein [Kiloniellaceae bacterium]|nr:FHA domain-containing protein [Kiloniellaceae bacterium]
MKNALKTYVIGRSSLADIVIPDESVAPRHAEVVITVDGRYYVTDCASAGGTWRRIAWQAQPDVREDLGAEAGWELLRQDFVAGDEELRFGDFASSLDRLFAASHSRHHNTKTPATTAMTRGDTAARPQGRVERDPLTGQIVRKRPE